MTTVEQVTDEQIRQANAYDEFETLIKFLALDVYFYRHGCINNHEQLSSVDDLCQSVVMKIEFKGNLVRWQYVQGDFSEKNFIGIVRNQFRLAMSWIGKFNRDRKYAIGLFLSLLKNGIWLRCNNVDIYVPRFDSLAELKLKLAIMYGSDENPLEQCFLNNSKSNPFKKSGK